MPKERDETHRRDHLLPRRLDRQPQFCFSLWTPAASEVEDLAMADAQAKMADALGAGLTIIRGQIG